LVTYLQQRREEVMTSCPLPSPLQHIVAGYADMSYDEKREFEALHDQEEGLDSAARYFCCGVDVTGLKQGLVAGIYTS
jgi:hypothetical protein